MSGVTGEETSSGWHPLTAAMRCLEGALEAMADALVLAAEGKDAEGIALIAQYMDNTDSLTDDDYRRISHAAKRKIGAA